jgi:uncharacterized protein
MHLQQYLKKTPRIAVGYSGGVDSSYLLYAAKTAGCDVRAYFIKSQFQPRLELNEAIRFSARHGISLTVDALNILEDPNIAKNPPDRCYYCKNLMLKRVRELARADGYEVLADGTNADDDEADRPGMRALSEQGVLSPLRECGLNKADIRRLSKHAELSTHDKPSYACLATRIPSDTPITVRLLEKIERAEEALHDMGFTDMRVRFIPPGGVKIQLPDSQIATAGAKRAEILAALQPTFNSIVLDLEGRS